MLSDDEFRVLLQHHDRPWSGYRKVRKGVKKRLRRHMRQLGCTTVDAYLTALDNRPDQAVECEQCLLVTISRFFRDRLLWDFLYQHLLPEIQRRWPTPIRAWSAGCACGEEPYSLAITWARLFDTSALSIMATDTQTVCLERAQKGIYTTASLKEMSEELRYTFFRPLRAKRQWCVIKSKLPMIQWRQHQLFEPPPQGAFHMIFLRNSLLTYHRGTRLRLALTGILSALIPGGYLIVGSHETPPPWFKNLKRIQSCPWVYRLTN